MSYHLDVYLYHSVHQYLNVKGKRNNALLADIRIVRVDTDCRVFIVIMISDLAVLYNNAIHIVMPLLTWSVATCLVQSCQSIDLCLLQMSTENPHNCDLVVSDMSINFLEE